MDMDLTTTTPCIAIESETQTQPEAAFDEGEQDFLPYDCSDLLRQAGLRPTRQRLMLGSSCFRTADAT